VADALGTLWRLRRLHAEEARRTLAAALAAEAEAANRLQSALAAPAREAAALGRQPSRQMTNAYAAWLPAAARAIHSCRRAGDSAAAASAWRRKRRRRCCWTRFVWPSASGRRSVPS
jgi:hypothetical protein